MKGLSKETLKKFRGKHILLTGASGGLGRAFGLELARCGARTLVLSGRNGSFLQHLAEECREVSTCFMEVHIIPCELSDPEDVVKLGKEALRLCNVNVLINNAGVSSRADFLESSVGVDQMMMQVNFLAGAALAKMIVPGMVERGSGCVLWISSVQGYYSLPGCTSYAASKFAVQGYCEAMRAELAKTGVSVHVASPGFIRTKFSLSVVAIDMKSKGAPPEKVSVDVLNAVAKGKRDFFVAASFSDRACMFLRFAAPSVWNRHLVKVHDENVRLAAEKAAAEISINDGVKDLDLEEVNPAESKDTQDADTISIVSQKSEAKLHLEDEAQDESKDSGEGVIVECPSDMTGDHLVDTGDDDSDSVESVGSQLARLAAKQ